MARWAPDAAGRMRDAAYLLFAKHGFADVSAEEIAMKAGVTERTFYRHFKTKEDVLFSSGDEIVSVLVEGMSSAPIDAPPMVALRAGIVALATEFERERDDHRVREAVIRSDPALQERNLLKQHHIMESLLRELIRRGASSSQASVTAGVGMVVFQIAYRTWTTDRSRTGLLTRIDRAFDQAQADLAVG